MRNLILILMLLFSSCSLIKVRVNPEVVNHHLAGGWSADKGTIWIDCDGNFNYTANPKPYHLEVRYDSIQGGSIKAFREHSLLIQTFPMVSSEFEMKKYPTAEPDGTWKMSFYDDEWTRTRELFCTEDSQKYLEQNPPL